MKLFAKSEAIVNLEAFGWATTLYRGTQPQVPNSFLWISVNRYFKFS